MNTDTRTTRWLGAAFLAKFTTSMAAAVLTARILAGGAAYALAAASANPALMRAGALLELLTGAGVVALATLMFAKLGDVDRPRALVAQGLWLGEALLIAVSGLALYALGALGAQPAYAGSLASATIAFSLYQNAFTAHMLFWALGAPLWYSLLYRSDLVPRWMAGWGLITSLPLLVSTLLTLWDRGLSLGFIPGLPYAPFELVVGVWLIVTAGRQVASRRSAAPARLGGAVS